MSSLKSPVAATRWRAGFTVPELLLGLAVMSVLLVMAGPSFSTSRVRTSVRHSADEFASAVSRAQAEAAKGAGLTRFQTDAGTGRFWIEVDTTWGGGGSPLIVGGVRDVSTRHVMMTTTQSHLCFNARGLPTKAYGCPAGNLVAVFWRGSSVDTVQVSAAGKIYRR